MGVVWHSAARALTLFTGAKTDVVDSSMVQLTQSSMTREKGKRAAEEELDESDRCASGTAQNTITHSPPSRVGHVPQFAPKPHVPSMANLQRRYSQPHSHQGRPATVGISGSQAFMAPSILSPSPLLPEMLDSSYMQDANAFGAQLSTAVIPHLYSSGFLDDVEGPPIHHGMPPQQQSFQFHYPPLSHSHPSQMASQLGHYELQEGLPPPFSSHSQQPHLHHPHLPRRTPIRSTGHQQDVYLPQRFNVYSGSFPSLISSEVLVDPMQCNNTAITDI
jgi:hypothetical protein